MGRVEERDERASGKSAPKGSFVALILVSAVASLSVSEIGDEQALEK